MKRTKRTQQTKRTGAKDRTRRRVHPLNPEPHSPPMDICISTTIFGKERESGVSLPALLERLCAAEFRWLEVSRKHLDSDLGEIAASGLRVWSVHGELSSHVVGGDTAAAEKAVATELARMDRAAQFAPCPYVIHYLNRSNDPVVGTRFRAAVEALAVGAQRCGLVLAVETVPFKPDVDARYADSTEVARFVRDLGVPHVGVCVDLNHSNLRERLADVAVNCRGLVANIHVSDNRGAREEHLPPGEGGIDFVAALRALREAGYGGPLNLECHLSGPPTVATLTTLRQGAEALVRSVGEP